MNENECFFLPKKIVFFSVCMCNDDDDDEKMKEKIYTFFPSSSES